MTAACLQDLAPLDRDLALTPTAVRELLEQQSILLRVVVHEMRRPLTVADGWLAMIQEGSLGPLSESQQAQQGLSAMAGAVKELRTLIDGLAAAAMHEDRAVLRRQRYPLRRVIASAVAAVDHEARSRQITVDRSGPDVEVDIDPQRLRIALLNLISNAIRHSPTSSTVGIVVQPDVNAVTVTVRDDGPGILPADAEHIFDRWYQGPGASTGLGLGLWIVRQIVEWHRGHLTLDSVPGHGSAFHVVLPWSGDTAARLQV